MPAICLLLASSLAAASAAGPESLAKAAAAAGRELASKLGKEKAGIKKVAVAAFSEPASAVGQGAVATDLVAKSFASASKLALVDRAATAAIAAEAKIQTYASGKGLGAVGARAGAQAILVGALLESADGVILQARLVMVETGKVVASARRAAALPKGKVPAAAAGAVESSSVEVAMRRLSDSLAAGFSKLPGNSRYRRLAVVPFTDVGEQAQKRRIGTIVAAEVATDLRRDHNLLLVERQKLTEVMAELRVQQSGAVDSSSAAQIGKIADAQALVIGTASDLGDRYLVDARVVATETGETLAADSASVTSAGMVALASEAVVLRSKKDAVFRSVLIPGWGQIYNRQPVKGFVILGAEVGLFASALAFHLAGEKAYRDYTGKTSAGSLGSDPTAEAQRLYDTAALRFRLRNTMLYVAGGLWLANIVDAYISGVDGDRVLSGGVARAAERPAGRRVALVTDGTSLIAAVRW